MLHSKLPILTTPGLVKIHSTYYGVGGGGRACSQLCNPCQPALHGGW